MIDETKRPEGCTCNEIHKLNKNVCAECWAKGYRYDAPHYKRVWWNREVVRTIKIIHDEDAENPREEWDNFGTMVCLHSRYSLGDKDGYETLQEAVYSHKNYKEWWHDENNPNAYDEQELSHWVEIAERLGMIVLPLYLYDHSGITMNTTGFSCRWDSGQVGIIFITREDIRKEFQVKRVSKKLIESVKEILVAQVETYDKWLTGDIWGFQRFEDGEEVDSCWGFYGSDPKENGMLDHWPKEFHNIEPEIN